MSSYRPRRTRIYGANYDIGESSYKKLLESIDNKRGVGRSIDSHVPLTRETSLPPKVTFSQDEDDFDREKYRASLRAKLQLDDEGDDLFGATLKKSKLRLAERNKFLEDEDEDILGSAYKPLKFKGIDESGVESSLKASLKYRASAEPFESSFKSLKLNGADESAFGESIKSRALKAIERPGRARSILNDLDDQQEASTFSSRRIKIRSENVIMGDSSTTTETSSRMKATKARLADLDAEMSSINDKQSEREKRKHNLRKLLNESEADTFKAIEL
ncbi:PREDICTED: uncharacterized protein LOC108366689 [Rhagoletis zephyria]|uniref:uncharacterized protein LOC108366689 n=1 Tax=Rhagoletis zephyria TaxID=28612 RepID=UPI00081199AE|nr:PREDICTED: uncharacterized protein LOC108366689 [Rhagoletis zephyria]